MLTDEHANHVARLYLCVLRRTLPKGIPRTVSGGKRLAKLIGVDIRLMALRRRTGGYLADNAVYLDPSLPPAEILIRIIHEFIEALAQRDMPGLIDDELMAAICADRRDRGLTKDDRHQVADAAHQLAADELQLITTPGSSFTWKDWIHIAQPSDKLRYAKPIPPLEPVDGLGTDHCL